MEKLYKFEKYFFLLILVLNLSPIFETTFFPTLDGPAHLYNSNLINELWFGNNDFLSQYYSINPKAIPNWIGHFLLSLFNLFLPAVYSEKTLLLIYFIGLPLSFRFLIKTVSPKSIGLSYFVFPFVYSFTFALGFYNFSLALPLLFFTLAFWLRQQDSISKRKTVFILFLLITATYFSHLFVFILLLFIIVLHILWTAILENMDNKSGFEKSLEKAIAFLKASFFPIVLIVLYYFYRTPSGKIEYLGTADLINSLKNGDTIISYDRYEEQNYTRKIFYVFAGLILFSLVKSIYLKFVKQVKTKFSNSMFWGLISLFLLTLYFLLPDSDQTAGYVSSRLGLLVFFFAAIWLSTRALHSVVVSISVVVLLFLNHQLMEYHMTKTSVLDVIALECFQASRFIEPNKVVLPIDESQHGFMKHFSNYLGIEKPLVVMENYEASTGYFPIIWKKSNFPQILLGNQTGFEYPCLYWKSNPNGLQKKADYIFVLKNGEIQMDSCKSELYKDIRADYNLLFKSDHTNLFGLKKPLLMD